jgi:hypothetical protein
MGRDGRATIPATMVSRKSQGDLFAFKPPSFSSMFRGSDIEGRDHIAVGPTTTTNTTTTTSQTPISYGVTVNSPLNGSASGSPVHFVASASSSHPITYMRIYLDNVSVYGAAVSTVNTYVPMGVGWHNVVVQAWDSTGVVFKTGVKIQVQ